MSLMIGGIAESMRTAPLRVARIVARFRSKVAVLVVRALIVVFALGTRHWDAVATYVQAISVFDRTDAVAALVYDHTTLESAHTAAALVDLQPLLGLAEDAFVVFVECRVRWAFAFSIRPYYVSLIELT